MANEIQSGFLLYFDTISLFPFSFDLSYTYIKPPHLTSHLPKRVIVTLSQADCLNASQTSVSIKLQFFTSNV